MLTAKLSLHGIDDVEAFALAIVQRSRLELSYHDREDLVAYLLAECWQLSVDFEPGGISFSTYAGTTLKLRVVDWQRKRFGRTRYVFHDRVIERPRVELVSLDDPDYDRLATALGTRTGDPTAIGIPTLHGYSKVEIARELGTSSSWVSKRLDELRAELERLALPR